MDFNKNVSVAPMDFYNRLTACLADRKKLKVNLGSIPGMKDNKKKPISKILTNQRINEKFLAKYAGNRELQGPNRHQDERQNVS
jgi:hypothetical protein